MTAVREVLYFVVFLYFLVLIGRVVFDWIRIFAREWRPRGAALAVASLALATLTGCRPPHHGTTVAPYFSVSASKRVNSPRSGADSQTSCRSSITGSTKAG